GIGEGIARGDGQEIISSVPVISNIYNAAEGAATGDGKRTATALITLVPYVGSGYIIADGVASNDTAETVGGTIGLGLDFVTEGEGHLLTRGHVVGHSALADGKVASRTFSHHEVPAAVRMQAQHSLGALRDLGMDDRALMLTDKAGEHGSVGDPYGLLAASDGAAPSGAEMHQLLERLTPVPEDKRPVAMRRAEGGTWQDPQTLAHYAQIGAKLYRVAKDEAASTEGYVVWNPVDATGNARERTVRLENRDGQWQQARNAPGLKGGAPEPVLRVMDADAAKQVDLPVPQAYANANRVRQFGLNNERPLPVSETETVSEVRKFLSECAKDVTRREGFAQGFDEYFDVSAQQPDGTYIPSEETHTELKEYFTRLYDKSETFRSLYNFAADSSRIDPIQRWLLAMGERDDIKYEVSNDLREMYAPHPDMAVDYPAKFLSKNGEFVDIDSKVALVHEMTHLLTGLKDPDLAFWNEAGVDRSVAHTVRQFGLGERGAVEYFTQRILREADAKVPQRQTYLVMTSAVKAHVEKNNVANYVELDRYVSLQDDYLAALFPGAVEQPAFGRARAHESDRFVGSDPDNKHYSGPTGSGKFDLDPVYWKPS
ncbi:PipA/GogA/GtgA family type III secretion system effector, partial [Paraburkholderia humisilvae]|uniref:PipA/GogA/GtgA family type III secretion system effector n=1 Tax=Paraburkholderia humisilvae TaxID=627669 RepID=UPI0035F0D446